MTRRDRFRSTPSAACGACWLWEYLREFHETAVLNGVGGGNSNQWLAQLAGVVTLVGFVLPMTYSLNWLLNRFYPQRVPAEGEPHGLDLYELGAGAYPEFVIHREDFRPR